jgi:hypothetical protein
MRRLYILLAVLVLVVGLAPVAAQEEAVPAADSGVEITWPVPVSEVWGVVPVIGTVNVPDLAVYFIEAIPLNEDLSIPQNAPWLPISAGASGVVNDSVIAEIDTSDAPDGLYAIRLSVTTATDQQYTYVVSPLRLNNERYESERERILALLGVATPEPTEEPPTPTPDAVVDDTPRVTPAAGNASVNVRRCDIVDNDRCPILAFLPVGVEAPALARSANATGWFQIRLASGVVGWVSPTVVEARGNVNSLPLVAPPAPLPPPPTAQPASPTVMDGLSIDGGALTCGVPGIVRVNVTNPGTTTSNPGTVTVQSVALRTGDITATSTGTFPALAPRSNYVVVVALTVTTFFNEQQQIRALSNNQQLALTYTLAQGNCGGGPAPTAAPTERPTTRSFARGECTLDILPNAYLRVSPLGPVVDQAGPDGQVRDASTVTLVQGQVWYELFADRAPIAWVSAADVRTNQPACLL